MLSNLQRHARSFSDNRPSSARPIGVLSGTRAFRDSVSLKDKVDYYSFTFTGHSSFNLSLTKLQNNVNVFLAQAGRVLLRSARGGKKPEVITAPLEAGTYYVQVRQKRGNSRYKLSLKASPLSPTSPNTTPVPRGSRRALSFRGSAAPGLGFVDLNTGVISRLTVTGSAADIAMSDVAVSGNDLFATSYSNDLYKVNATTGASTLIGNLGLIPDRTTPYITGLAFTPSGVLYATTANARALGKGSPDGLYTVSLTTGKASLVAAFPSGVDSEDIVYDNLTGRFISVGSSAGGSSLASIGLAGDVRSLGPTSVFGIEGLLFDNGVLYGFTGGDIRSQLVFPNLRQGNTYATRDRGLTGTSGIISGAA